MSEKYEEAIPNKQYGNAVSLSKKDRQQGSTFDVSADRELMRLPTMKGERYISDRTELKENFIQKRVQRKVCVNKAWHSYLDEHFIDIMFQISSRAIFWCQFQETYQAHCFRTWQNITAYQLRMNYDIRHTGFSFFY